MANLLRIRDSKKYRFAHINIRVNITRSFLDILDDFMCSMESLFGDDPRFTFSFLPAKDYSRNKSSSDMFVDASEVRPLLLSNEVFINKFYPESFKKQIIDPGEGCTSWLKNSYVIAPDLKVYKCCAHYDMEENYLGRIDLEGNLLLNEAIHSKWYLANKFIEKTTDSCRECFYMPVCPSSGKGCPASCVRRNSSSMTCPLKDADLITALTESVLYTVRNYPHTILTL